MSKQRSIIIRIITFIISITIVLFLGSILTLYVYAGNLVFGNNSYSAPSRYSTLDATQNSNIPEFYESLSKEKGEFSIIEYPAIVQDRYNPFPYYQSFHKRKYLNGYFHSHVLKKQWGIKNIFDSPVYPVEIILSRFVILGRLVDNKIDLTNIIDLFSGMIDLYDIRALRNSGARYILLHKHIMEEIIIVQNKLQNNNDLVNEQDSEIAKHVYNYSLHLKKYYKKYFGQPVHENTSLIVFQIP